MKTGKVFLLASSVVAVLLGSRVAMADNAYDATTCRAGTVTVLAQADKVFVWALDHRGVSMSSDPGDPFNGFTQRCIGTVGSVEGKGSATGWCKSVDPKTGDWTVVDWVGSGKPGHGTWSFRYGSGKWKGVTGGGTYEPLGPTRPVEPGTYQNCVRVKGTWSISS